MTMENRYPESSEKNVELINNFPLPEVNKGAKLMENRYPESSEKNVELINNFPLPDINKSEALRGNYDMAVSQNPDDAAKIVDLSKRFDESPNFIANNLDKAIQKANAPDFDELAKKFPVLSDYLMDKKRMAMAHDDIENLSHAEAAIQANSMLMAFGAGYQGSVIGLATRREMPEVEVPENAPFSQKLAAAAGGFVGDVPAMVAGGIAGAIPGIAGGPAAGVTAMAGAFALPTAIKQILIEHYQNGDIATSEELFRRIYSISKETIKSGAIGVATFGGAKLAGKALEGVAGAVAPKGAEYAIKPGAMTVARTTGELAGMTVGGAVVEGKAPTVEDAAINTFLIGALHSTGVIRGKMYDMRYEAMKAANSKVMVEHLAELSQASKLRERTDSGSVELPIQGTREYSEFLNRQSPPALIPVDKFDTFFQSQGIDPERAAADLNISETYRESRNSGGNVSIPMGTLQSKIMDRYRPGLVNDIKFDPDGYSVNEISERNAEYQEAIKIVSAESDKAIKENPALKGAHDTIYEDVKSNLSQAVINSEGKGVKESVDYVAKVTASSFISQGVRRGVDPMELYNKSKLSYQGAKAPTVLDLMQGATYLRYGRGESLNSLAAKSEGRAPKTVFAKMYKIPAKTIKFIDALYTPSEWHHTGKFANKTDFWDWEEIAEQLSWNDFSKISKYAPKEAKEIAYELLKSKNEKLPAVKRHTTKEKRISELAKKYGDFSWRNNRPYSEDKPVMYVGGEFKKRMSERLKDMPLTEENYKKILLEADKVADEIMAEFSYLQKEKTEAEKKENELYNIRQAEVISERNRILKKAQEVAAAFAPDFKQPAYGGKARNRIADIADIKEQYRWESISPDILFQSPSGSFGKVGKPITDTPEFKTWFEDSKVVDEQGKPLVVYHGTNAAFESFDKSLAGKSTGATSAAKGIFFVNDPKIAEGYAQYAAENAPMDRMLDEVYRAEAKAQRSGKKSDWDKHAKLVQKSEELDREIREKPERGQNIIPVYLSIKNPKIIDAYGEHFPAISEQLNKGIDSAKKAGHDGVIIKNLNDAAGSYHAAADHYVVFEPTQIKSVNNRGTFDPNNPNILMQNQGEARGAISFTDSGTIIKMFKAADATTALHELSHFWLKDISEYVKSGQADEKYTADWKTIQDYLGIKEGTDITREQQEKFAESFERYLMDGKAPSVELQGAFAKLKDWMIKIYDGVRRTLGIESITPEIRGVFDRLVATDEAIAEAKTEIGLDVSETPVALTGDALKARQQAEAILLKPMMEDLSKANKAKLESERKRITTEAESQIAQEPIYDAIDSLRKAIGIEKDTFTETPVRNAAQKFVDGTLDANKTALFEAEAELRGFSSGDEMAKKILESDTREAAIQKIVNEKMGQYDRLADRAAIKEDALKALHSGDNMGKLLSLEMQVLEGMKLDKEIRAELSKERRANASREWEMIKAQAAETLGNKPITEAGKFRTYYTMERKAAERVARAMAKKDTAAAIKAKREQLVSHALAAEAIRLRERINKDISYLDDQRKADKKLFKKEEHFEQIAGLLSRFGMGRDDFNIAEKKESLNQWATRVAENYGEVVSAFPDWIINEYVTKDLKSLTANELKELRAAVSHIKHIANNENQVNIGERRAMVDALAGELHAAQVESGNVGKLATTSTAQTWPDKIIAGKDWIRHQLITVETLLRKLDGYKDNGIWQKAFFEGYKKSADNRAKDMVESAAKYREIWEVYTPKEREAMDSKKIFVPEIGVSLTKAEIITAALNWGTETNRQRLIEGSGKYKDSDGRQWTEEAVNKMFEREMTKRDWDTIQKTWDMIDSFWPRISALYERITGFAPERLERMPVQTPFGEYEGGYFPLRRDPRIDIRGDEQLQAEQMLGQIPIWQASTKNGFTKNRIIGAVYPVSLDIRGINKHMTDVIHDLNLREWVLDTNRLLNNKEIQVSIQDALGMEGFRTVKKWVKDIAGTKGYESMDTVLREIRRRTIISSLGLRVGSAILQAGDLSAYGRVDPKNFGVIHVASSVAEHYAKIMATAESQKDAIDFVYSKSKYMKYERGENVDRDISEAARNSFGKEDKIGKASMFMITTVDRLLSIPVWKEAYKVGLELHKGNESDAISYADGIIRRAQSAGRLGEMPEIMRGGEFKKALTMFYSFISKRANIWYEQIDKTKTAADVPELVGTAMALWIVPSLFSAFVRNGLPSDDKKQKKYMKELLSYPFSLFPVVRDVADYSMDKALGLPSFGYSVTPMSRSAELIGDLVGKVAQGKSNKMQKTEAAAKVASYAVPYPDQINAWIFNAADYANGMAPKPGDILRRRPVKERR